MKNRKPKSRSTPFKWAAIGILSNRVPGFCFPAAAVLLLLPELARACSVCAASLDGGSNLFEYYLTTILMLSLPITLVGGGGLLIRHYAKKHAQKQQDAS